MPITYNIPTADHPKGAKGPIFVAKIIYFIYYR